MSETTCFVYKIPKLSSAQQGHRAELWDLAKVAVENTLLSVTTEGTNYRTLNINIYQKTSDKKNLVAVCTFNLYDTRDKKLDFFVEEVVDSSRYFVLRLVDQKRNNRHAQIGAGFRERDEAIQFKESLYGYVSGIRREIQAEEMKESSSVANADVVDRTSTSIEKDDLSAAATISKLSLKEGEKIHVEVKGSSRRRTRTSKGKVECNGVLPLLRPPPSASRDRKDTWESDEYKNDKVEKTGAPEELESRETADNNDDDDDGWGSFEMAN